MDNSALPQNPPAHHPVVGRTRGWTLYGTSAFFVFAGLNHFISPDWYLANQMPPWVPHPVIVVYLSGVAEILGGMGLVPAATRKWAGWGLIALLVAVFPGNIHMAAQALSEAGWTGSTLGLILVRLPLQAVFILVVVWVMRIEPAPTKPGE